MSTVATPSMSFRLFLPDARAKANETIRQRANQRFHEFEYSLDVVGMDLYDALADAGWRNALAADRAYHRHGRKRPEALRVAACREYNARHAARRSDNAA